MSSILFLPVRPVDGMNDVRDMNGCYRGFPDAYVWREKPDIKLSRMDECGGLCVFVACD